MTANSHEGCFWDGENVLKWDYGDGFITLSLLKIIEVYPLKMSENFGI